MLRLSKHGVGFFSNLLGWHAPSPRDSEPKHLQCQRGRLLRPAAIVLDVRIMSSTFFISRKPPFLQRLTREFVAHLFSVYAALLHRRGSSERLDFRGVRRPRTTLVVQGELNSPVNPDYALSVLRADGIWLMGYGSDHHPQPSAIRRHRSYKSKKITEPICSSIPVQGRCAEGTF